MRQQQTIFFILQEGKKHFTFPLIYSKFVISCNLHTLKKSHIRIFISISFFRKNCTFKSFSVLWFLKRFPFKWKFFISQVFFQVKKVLIKYLIEYTNTEFSFLKFFLWQHTFNLKREYDQNIFQSITVIKYRLFT